MDPGKQNDMMSVFQSE